MPTFDLGLEHVSLDFATKTIFTDVTQGVFEGDRIGIVGRNGDGKSTLLHLLEGTQAPDSGRVTTRNGLTFGMLDQRDQLDDDATIREAALEGREDYEWAAQTESREIVEALLGGLNLNARIGTLSGGQRRRADLARLLLKDWDVLALDEPTNHLDVVTIHWLAEHLKNRWAKGTGALLIVTHDRWFLDEVCESMWEVHDGQIEPFEGGYSAYMLQRVERDRQADVRETKRRNLARKELAWLSRGARARSTKQKFHVKAARELIADVPPMRNTLELKQMATSRLGKQVVDLVDVTQIFDREQGAVADIDPDSPGLEIFNVYEEGERAPYGWALRDAETGDVRFGEYAEEDLGRCMIGKIDPNTRGLQVWVKDVYDVNGRTLELPTPGTNMKIYWAGDLSTQITDGADYLHGDQYGVINDLTHGVMLQPAGTATNNGTKGNPCLVADVLGDFREELLVRTADDTAIRIYTTTDLTPHKLFTLMHDAQYRCGVAWQNNCYNQPCYPSFYYANDMDFANVLPQLNAKPTLWMAGDSIMQSYAPGDKPVTGWGEMLHTLAHGDAVCQTAHRADCPFPQEMRYELPGLVIDNCAMAGRSSKTFREEGRLDDIAAHIRPGDLLVVSFGHNDANRAKAERYVPADAFGESLRPFWDAARSHGAVCIFASPVAMREFDEAGVCYPSFAAYREAMRAFAAEVGAPFIDLGAATAAANTAFGAERCKARYMWVGAKQDNAHQQNAGACRTAQAFVQQLLQDTTPALDVLRANFK